MSTLPANPFPEWNLSIRTTLLPKETNHHGTIFGGVILSYIDVAGAIEARRLCTQMVVTVAMKEVVFKEPVLVGDLVSFFTRITKVGRTSITTEVRVVSTRQDFARTRVDVTEATVTYVAVDGQRRAEPIHVRVIADDLPAFSEELVPTYQHLVKS
ncbi:MAG: acyl-CoA thioesterase [Acidobacteria bacterium]|nr:acyl-CoA thioesterase [Acidobacteriota bacterium]MCB9396982.1 acyl-CoA thioesterase [Acidobacteriota bacterium]